MTARPRRPRQIDKPHSEQVSAGGKRGCWRKSTRPWRVCILGTWWVFPVGEEWNQASVPRLFRLFIDEQELGDGATFGHDELYRYHGALPRAWLDRDVPKAIYRTYTRAEADTFLHQMALLEGAEEWKASAGHTAVSAWWWCAEALRLSPAW